MPDAAAASPSEPSDVFMRRHIGPGDADVQDMLRTLGCGSLDALMDQTVPASIRARRPLDLPPPRGEHELLAELRTIAAKNRVFRSMIGMGYYDCITPPVIQRNILENPGWYTQYTPYQAEISQGRLEAMLNFQTLVSDLTGLPLANASLLDEATAAAEAMTMCLATHRDDADRRTFFVADDCHPQTINVVKTRARPLGVEVVVGNVEALFRGEGVERLESAFGMLLQSPTTDGRVVNYEHFIAWVHKAGVRVVVATDLLACTLIRPPGEFGTDIAIGSAQRFGVPMGFGGPHAAFLATREEYARQMPGRIIGVSKDAHGRPAYRLAIQTREQHIRREKATSNICTAQALLANVAGMYAVYHGPEGLRRIARRVHTATRCLALALCALDHEVKPFEAYFDTIRVRPRSDGEPASRVLQRLHDSGINVRNLGDGSIGISCDETTTPDDLDQVAAAFNCGRDAGVIWKNIEPVFETGMSDAPSHERSSPFLTHPVFNSYHSETELLRYMKRLENRDLSLTQSMIPLGSCTMKLNATSEMLPITWPEFARMHPFAPAEQAQGYARIFADLEAWLAEITGLPAVSLQPNAGSQGEFAGLLAIRAYHEHDVTRNAETPKRRNAEMQKGSRGRGIKEPRESRKSEVGSRNIRATVDTAADERSSGFRVPSSEFRVPSSDHSALARDVCLIPASAHGTNPASAVSAGFRVVPVACDARGNIDVADLKAKASEHADRLGALMVTYPSTHGVFEEAIIEICRVVHDHGGLVYMDGANMNAQVGLCRPGEIGADVCHLNLHKTFCIPHGGGGPGMGPICATEDLRPFLPGPPVSPPPQAVPSVGPVSAAPYGSAGILPISWMYIALMGGPGLRRATEVAILNANYMAERLKDHYPILYSGRDGHVAHEFIADCRAFEKSAGVRVEDVAKRLMDFGFHAPTISFPVPGTLMIEPTESESKAELDRFCDALIAIREEIRAIEEGRADRADNPLKHAPHTAEAVTADDWTHAYSRRQAAFPAPWVRDRKFWPPVGRIDSVWGDRHLFCTCPPMDAGATRPGRRAVREQPAATDGP